MEHNNLTSLPIAAEILDPIKTESSPSLACRACWEISAVDLRSGFAEAFRAWLAKSKSASTRSNYARDLSQFLEFAGIKPSEVQLLAEVRPERVAAWRDELRARKLANSSILRKLTALRSLYSYLKSYGYVGPNPAHPDFVDAPAVSRDGKTVALTPEECRRLIETPDHATAVGVRDRAILSVLAYSACRVGELVGLNVRDYQQTGGYRVLHLVGKGDKERRTPLHPEACDDLERWLDVTEIRADGTGALFRPVCSGRGGGSDGFRSSRLSKRAVQRLVRHRAIQAGVNLNATVHSLRVTALTTARERGADILDLQNFAGHADPRTTLTYLRDRDRLAKSPTYLLKY